MSGRKDVHKLKLLHPSFAYEDYIPIDGQEFSEQTRMTLTAAIMQVFAEWRLEEDQMLVLLGYGRLGDDLTTLRHKLTKTLPNTKTKLSLATSICHIYQVLQAIYPESANYRLTWIKRKNKLLNDLSPLDVMLRFQLKGVFEIIRILEGELAGMYS